MTKYIAIHHTAVERTTQPQLQAVNRYHQGKWNMKSRLGYYVGYNHFIDVDGTATQTRAWMEETMANKGHNCDVLQRCDTISVCLADNYNVSGHVSQAQNASLSVLIRDIKKHYPKIKVVGHRDIQTGRTCPGGNIDDFDFEAWNSLTPDDPEDSQKAKEIKALQTRLDSLLKILQRMLLQLKGK
jgi:hypothetical protein